jgi:hypothetical protein
MATAPPRQLVTAESDSMSGADGVTGRPDTVASAASSYFADGHREHAEPTRLSNCAPLAGAPE